MTSIGKSSCALRPKGNRTLKGRGNIFLEVLILSLGLTFFSVSLLKMAEWLEDSKVLYDQAFGAARRKMIQSDHFKGRMQPTADLPEEVLNLEDGSEAIKVTDQ